MTARRFDSVQAALSSLSQIPAGRKHALAFDILAIVQGMRPACLIDFGPIDPASLAHALQGFKGLLILTDRDCFQSFVAHRDSLRRCLHQLVAQPEKEQDHLFVDVSSAPPRLLVR